MAPSVGENDISAGNLAWGPKAAKNLTEAFDKFLTGPREQAVLMLHFNGRCVG